MLALQTQAQALQTRVPLSRDEALRQLQSLTPNAQIQLNVQGERVSVQLKAVPAATLAQWLSQARSQAQALPVEAHLTRSNASGTNPNPNPNAPVTWDGNLVLSLPNRGGTAH
jgi:general secretion pathway protein M